MKADDGGVRMLAPKAGRGARTPATDRPCEAHNRRGRLRLDVSGSISTARSNAARRRERAPGALERDAVDESRRRAEPQLLARRSSSASCCERQEIARSAERCASGRRTAAPRASPDGEGPRPGSRPPSRARPARPRAMPPRPRRPAAARSSARPRCSWTSALSGCVAAQAPQLGEGPVGPASERGADAPRRATPGRPSSTCSNASSAAWRRRPGRARAALWSADRLSAVLDEDVERKRRCSLARPTLGRRQRSLLASPGPGDGRLRRSPPHGDGASARPRRRSTASRASGTSDGASVAA